jgi:hypothetical protein
MEKTLTFTVEDALLSPIGFSILSGAGLIKGKDNTEKVHVHTTTATIADASGKIDLADALGSDTICEDAPIFVVKTEVDGSVTGEVIEVAIGEDKKSLQAKEITSQTSVLVDYYVVKGGNVISELQIDAENFAGYYYVEASTLFRR